MKKRLSISLLSFLIGIIFSCKKDETSTSSNPTIENSMTTFNAEHKKPTQNFILNANTGGSIITSGGIEFSFPANSLVSSSGNPISGNVDVKIDEVITKADLLFNSISTHSNGRPLKSGGAFRLKVTQGGQDLSMAPGQKYRVLLTSNYNEPLMEIYYGTPTNDQYGHINWTTTPPGIMQNVFTHSTDSINVYEMFVEEFDWINCDYPYEDSVAELKVTLPDSYLGSMTMALDNSAMIGVHMFGSQNKRHWAYAPLNKPLSVVVLKRTADEYIVSAKTFTFTGQEITMPPFTTISETDLETLIATFQ